MRNFNNVQHAALRLKCDDVINDLHDELETAYYQHWKLDQSYDWFGFDKKSTLSESKFLFDNLHGLLFHLHTLTKKAVNDQDGDFPDSELFEIPREVGPPHNTVAEARSYISSLVPDITPAKTRAIKDRIQADMLSRHGKTVTVD